jgi:hypothetical protein
MDVVDKKKSPGEVEVGLQEGWVGTPKKVTKPNASKTLKVASSPPSGDNWQKKLVEGWNKDK